MQALVILLSIAFSVANAHTPCFNCRNERQQLGLLQQDVNELKELFSSMPLLKPEQNEKLRTAEQEGKRIAKILNEVNNNVKNERIEDILTSIEKSIFYVKDTVGEVEDSLSTINSVKSSIINEYERAVEMVRRYLNRTGSLDVSFVATQAKVQCIKQSLDNEDPAECDKVGQEMKAALERFLLLMGELEKKTTEILIQIRSKVTQLRELEAELDAKIDSVVEPTEGKKIFEMLEGVLQKLESLSDAAKAFRMFVPTITAEYADLFMQREEVSKNSTEAIKTINTFISTTETLVELLNKYEIFDENRVAQDALKVIKDLLKEKSDVKFDRVQELVKNAIKDIKDVEDDMNVIEKKDNDNEEKITKVTDLLAAKKNA